MIDNEKKIANAISKKRGSNEEEEEIEEPEPSQSKKSHGHIVANITEVCPSPPFRLQNVAILEHCIIFVTGAQSERNHRSDAHHFQAEKDLEI